jgi:transposase
VPKPSLTPPETTIRRGPKPVAVLLTDEQRIALQTLIRRHLTPQQVVLRAQIILDAADGQSNLAIARSRQVSLEAVRLWRERWMLSQPIPLSELSLEERLRDAPRSGKRPRITAEQICAIVAMACEAPSLSGRPITHWTNREIADEIIKRGIVAYISPRHAARILKKSGPQTALGSRLVELGPDARFETRVIDVCQLYHDAPGLAQQFVRVLSTDEMTGVQALGRKHPTLMMTPGQAERREEEYIRHGTLCFIVSRDVATGQVVAPSCGPTRTEADFVNHIRGVVATDPQAQQWHFVADNLNTHCSESLVRYVAEVSGLAEDLGVKGKRAS